MYSCRRDTATGDAEDALTSTGMSKDCRRMLDFGVDSFCVMYELEWNSMLIPEVESITTLS